MGVTKTDHITKEMLELAYSSKRVDDIALEFAVDRTTIYNLLHKFGIKVKNNSEAQSKRLKNGFHSLLPTKNLKHLIGKKLGKITILGHPFVLRNGSDRRSYVVVECDCGNVYIRALRELYKNGKLFSQYGEDRVCCSLCRNEMIDHSSIITHGETQTRLWNIWRGMKSRCSQSSINRKTNRSYIDRKIEVDKEWSESFVSFKNWAYENGFIDEDPQLNKMEKLSLDRIDPHKNYCPENCRWIPLKENIRRIIQDRDKKIKCLENKCSIYEQLLHSHGIKIPKVEDIS